MYMPSGSAELSIDAGAEPAISDIEWQVALLARRDVVRGGWQADRPRLPRLSRLIELLTGLSGVRGLANERLEKLRLFLCMTIRGDRRAEIAAAELIAMGYAPLALRRLEAVVAR